MAKFLLSLGVCFCLAGESAAHNGAQRHGAPRVQALRTSAIKVDFSLEN